MKLQETGEITTLKTQRILKWKGTYLNVGEGGGGVLDKMMKPVATK